MKNILRDFITVESRVYPFKIGKTVASSLTGFIVGAVAAHMIWFSAVKQIFAAIDF